MKNPTRRAWLGLARDLLALATVSFVLISPVQAAGGGSGTGAKPTLSTKDFDYYLTGDPADRSPRQPKSQMTVLMGGGLDVDQAFKDMIAKAGGSATNKIDVVVIRASGTDGYNPYLSAMEGVDSVETLVIKTPNGANDPKVTSVILGADVLFIAGGDQWNYISQWNETSVETIIKTVLLPKNVPIGGTSAGLAVLGAVDFSAQHGTITSSDALSDPYNRRLTLDRTFLETIPKLQNTIVDAHLVSRDRMGRLVTFLARMIQDGMPWSAARAIGVDEGTAVVIDGDIATVCANSGGTGAAYFLKLPQDPGTTLIVKPKTPLEVSSVLVDKLTQAAGDQFNMVNWLRYGGSTYLLYVQRGVLYGGPGNNPY
ncbi:cyanophycinase [Polaromonas sp. JS666]|uniref:cyanophycinase n=1 Tax=Polaromonas sp. (strain JS666 / ATCC BAA-500) TaxID=296591 RepID=UPI0000D5B3AC|nr:cyanophycinase [Polaromonas sp. JS666]ABE43587.1 peptidase S51, dipeptidase E [Polaromonas sp. JS666]